MNAPPLLSAYRADLKHSPIIEDTFEARIINPRIATVDDACREFFTNAPDWLQRTMKVRNKIVSKFGFAAGGTEPPVMPETIEPGVSFSLFEVRDRTETEILLGADDNHFSLRISLEVVDAVLRIGTVAHHHDAMGRAYLSLVKLPHGPIAKMFTNRIARGT